MKVDKRGWKLLKVDKMDDSTQKGIVVNKSRLTTIWKKIKWMKMNQSGWKLKRVDESWGKFIKVDEHGWKCMKVDKI